MKFFTNKETSKRIIIAILLVMSFNFITPNISLALGTPRGGKLFEPLLQFTCFIGDLFMKAMQSIFMGYGDIKQDDEFNIIYSPGVIFSNKVPALDVNFFNPMDSITVQKETGNQVNINKSFRLENGKKIDSKGTLKVSELKGIEEELNKKHGYTSESEISQKDFKNTFISVEEVIRDKVPNISTEWFETAWKGTDGKIYVNILTQTSNEGFNAATGKYEATDISYTSQIWQFDAIEQLDEAMENVGKPETEDKEIKSSASVLKYTIATWYKALRAIALVGLLSVLVYIGIRILISSTGQEKAKYKKMIIDWVAAICILFVLQYIMIFTLKIVESVTNILNVQIIGEDGRDNLISDIRGKVGGEDETEIDFANTDSETGTNIFAYTVMYLALVIETGIFSVHYLRRLIYMAFFTMIAPLIALTYPLDKIKDGQAQAFSMWIREYVFNALIQPVHLLLYYIFVGSAMNLATSNPLYAIVALGFMIPAEKFFRKMFGFEKASSVSQIGAAAGGALVMNAINKLGHKSGKSVAEKSEGGGNSKPSRLGSSNAATIGVGNGQAVQGNNGGANPNGNMNLDDGVLGSFGSERQANIRGATLKKALSSGKNIKNGVTSVRRKYFNKNTAKKAGRMVRKGLVGAAGATTLGTVGLAAGVATGDLSNALKYGAAGAGAGFMGANYVGDNLVRGEKNLRETFKEGAIGQDEYNNLKADKKFYESNEFRSMLNDRDLDGYFKDEHGNVLEGHKRTKAIRNAIQTYRDNGVTDTDKIKSAMKKGLTPQEGAYAIRLADKIGRSGWNNPKTREDFEKRYRTAIPGDNGDKIWNSIESLL